MKKIIYICSTNQNKINEINSFFENHKLDFQILKSPVDISEIVENGDSFYENAKIKALFLAEKINYSEYVLADDSGLCVMSLNNFPGINSARFSVDGRFDYEIKNDYLLNAVRNKDNAAKFICSLVLIDKNGRIHNFESHCKGRLRRNISPSKNGFGFDPIFFSDEVNKFFSDLTIEEKNKYSHRGKALKLLVDYFKDKNSIY